MRHHSGFARPDVFERRVEVSELIQARGEFSAA